jgi:ABC-type branched-subunit amino acid transport system substrate-binding protein
VDFTSVAKAFEAKLEALSDEGDIDYAVEACNDKGTPDGATQCLTKLSSDQDVDAVVGLTLNGGVYAPGLKNAGLAYVSLLPIAGADVSESALAMTGGSMGLIATMVEYFTTEEGVKQVADVNGSTSPAETFDAYAKLVAEANGAELVGGTLQLAEGQSDYLPLVSRAQDADAGAVFLAGAQGDYLPFLQAYKASGADFLIGGALSSIDADIIEAFAEAKVPLYVASQFGDPTGDELDNPAFRELMEETGTPADTFSQYGYAGAQMIDGAAKAIDGARDRAAFLEFLSSPDVSFDGGPMFTEPLEKRMKDSEDVKSIAGTTNYVGVYEGGKYRPLLDAPIDFSPYFAG